MSIAKKNTLPGKSLAKAEVCSRIWPVCPLFPAFIVVV